MVRIPAIVSGLVCFLIAATALAGQESPGATLQGWAPAGQPGVAWIDDIPDASPSPRRHALMRQKDLRFIPRVLAIVAGTTVEFRNDDPVPHTIYSISPAKRFNLGPYSGSRTRSVVFDTPGLVSILCDGYTEMAAWVVVLRNSYFALPGADGGFTISGIPAGPHTLRYWNQEGKTLERRLVMTAGVTQTVDLRTE